MSRASFSGALRTAGVLVLGAYGLHQLTYLLANGAGTGQVLVAQGHGYLLAFAPALVAGALGALLVTLAMSAFSSEGGSELKLGSTPEARSAILALAFLAVFATQELIEGALVASHPHGLAALAECWIALPLALPIGAIASLVLGGLQRADELIAAARQPRRLPLPRAPKRAGVPTSSDESLSELSCRTLSFGLTRRGPPFAARV